MQALQREMRPQDGQIALHALPFDLGFYTQAEQPAWIGDNWQDPEIPTRDNWRKELYDAAQFDPGVGKRVLLIDADFRKGQLNRYFGVPKEDGLFEVLSGTIPLTRAR
ncbi:hypothetical protein G6F57_020493 [Rhizopus arrhizus]|nr:hypothetical protein G6F57_020493 [Rhizopus arrhizus]